MLHGEFFKLSPETPYVIVLKKGMVHMGRAILFLLLALAIFSSCSSRNTIANSVPEREANEIVVLLNSKGIQAEKVAAPVSTTAGAAAEVVWDITVPGDQITDSLAILNQAGLPRIKGTTLLDLFGSQGLVPSDMQDKIRYQEGLSEQLATTIRKMDGIIDANVQITFPQEGETGKEMTASVYVKHRGILDNPNSLAITKIKRLVAASLPGLTPENVAVISDRALYSDITLQTPSELGQEREYASIWGVAVAKDSAPRFRLIFYIFIIILFILAAIVAWLVWKLFPTIEKRGIRTLYTPEQYGSKDDIHEEPKEPNP